MENDNIIHFSPNIEEYEDSAGVISDPYFVETALCIERRLPIAEAEYDADHIVRPMLKSFSQFTMAVHYLNHLKNKRMRSANREAAEALHKEALDLQSKALHLFGSYMFVASGSVDPETIDTVPDLQDIRAETEKISNDAEVFIKKLENFLEDAGSSVNELEKVFNRATSDPEHIGILMAEIACMYDDLCFIKNTIHESLADDEAMEECSYYNILELKNGEFELKILMEDIMAGIFTGTLLSTANKVEDDVVTDYCDYMYELIADGHELADKFDVDDDEDEDEDEED